MTRSKVEDTATPTLLSSPRSTPPATANNSTTADQRLHQNGETAVPTRSSPKTPLLQAQGGGGGGRGGRRINSNAAVPSYGSLQTYESADDAFVSHLCVCVCDCIILRVHIIIMVTWRSRNIGR